MQTDRPTDREAQPRDELDAARASGGPGQASASGDAVMHGVETLGLLAGTIAHDFNNLLMSISGFTSVALAETPPTSSVRTHLESIKIAADPASGMARELLDYSRPGGSAIELVNLNDTVREMVSLLRPLVPPHIDVSIASDTDLAVIRGDGTKIRRVIMNLITNAVDAIGAAPGRIVLTTGTRRFDDNGQPANGGPDGSHAFAFLEASDTGGGITADARARLFEPWFTTKSGPRGLGLSAVATIVQEHGGTVSVESEPGRGSRFQILLPLHETQLPDLPRQPAAHADRASRRAVLVVDDEPAVRSVTGVILERLGFEPVFAVDGPDALRQLADHEPDIIATLLDFTLPGMSGRDVLRAIRDRDPASRVIVTSGFSKDQTAGTIVDLKPTAFLQKPFGMEELSDQLNQMLGSAPPPRSAA